MAEKLGLLWGRYRYGIVYALIAGTYVVFSSRVVGAVGLPPQALVRIEQGKGLLFVITSAILAQKLLFSRIAQLDFARQALRERMSEPDAQLSSITVGAIGHEMKNVLQAAVLAAEYLRSSLLATTPDLVESEQDLSAALARLTELSRQLMALVRRDIDDSATSFDLARAAREAAQLLTPKTTGTNVAIVVEASRSCAVSGSLRQLEHALLNLIVNALQATSVRGSVRIVVSQRDNCGVLRVCDDGPGLPSEVLAHLFEPLTSTKRGGTGLGLALSRQILRLNGGDLQLISTSPSGTVFEVTLPLSSAAPSAPRKSARPAQRARNTAN